MTANRCKLVVEQLKSSMPVAELVQHNRLKIVGGQYNLERGAVEIIALGDRVLITVYSSDDLAFMHKH
jgi:hypothetical protein